MKLTSPFSQLFEIENLRIFLAAYVAGPGHGIQMKSGRLVLQGSFYRKDTNTTHQSKLAFTSLYRHFMMNKCGDCYRCILVNCKLTLC